MLSGERCRRRPRTSDCLRTTAVEALAAATAQMERLAAVSTTPSSTLTPPAAEQTAAQVLTPTATITPIAQVTLAPPGPPSDVVAGAALASAPMQADVPASTDVPASADAAVEETLRWPPPTAVRTRYRPWRALPYPSPPAVWRWRPLRFGRPRRHHDWHLWIPGQRPPPGFAWVLTKRQPWASGPSYENYHKERKEHID
jgi:hypothetical protein